MTPMTTRRCGPAPGRRAEGATLRSLARAAAVLAACCLAACAGERPQSTSSPGLESGITSNNGGGIRALGNQPSVGVTTRVGP